MVDPRAHVGERLDIVPADRSLTRGTRMHEVCLDIPTVAAGGLLHSHHLDRVLLRDRRVEQIDTPSPRKLRGTNVLIH
jgi:hypothetical protein